MSKGSSRRIHTHARAKRDLIEIFAYLSERNERAATQFLAEARQRFEQLLDMPDIGRRWKTSAAELKDLRVTNVSRRFRRYLVFYRIVSDGVQIVTVLHGARDLPTLIDAMKVDDPDS